MALFGAVAAFEVAQKAKLDPNQKVFINGNPVLEGVTNESAYNQCSTFSEAVQMSNQQPVIKVCGNQIKLTAHMLNRCEDHTHSNGQIQVGKCDTGAGPNDCHEVSPETHESISAFQSYKIESC